MHRWEMALYLLAVTGGIVAGLWIMAAWPKE